ncbi:L,D-transpeptidase family protein [Xanthobacter agilis]|uniref:L,D-transpeptidase family protein n=1 Tax=Xanthobacter agilis TaxID=47492 RepID=UPI00372C9E89
MGVTTTRHTGHAIAPTRHHDGRLARRVGASVISLALALSWLPAAEAGPGDAPLSPSPAAASARALLNGPRPTAPTTNNAGMGTADPPRQAEAAPVNALPVNAPPVSAVPVTATGAPRPATAYPSASGIDAAGNGESPAQAVATRPAPQALPIAPAAPRADAMPAAPLAPDHAEAPAPPRAAASSSQGAANQTAPDLAPNGPPVATPQSATAPVAPPALAPAHAAAMPVAPAQSPAGQTAAQSNPPPPAPAQATPAQAAIGAPAPAVAGIAGPLAPVAEAIAVQLAQPTGLGATKKETEALVAFYGARQGLPAFVDERGVNARGTAVLARLSLAEEDGLDPADYGVTKPPRGADAATLAATELRLAVAALTYARHAQSGRFDPNRISEMVTPTREIPDPAAVLATLSTVADVNGTLAAFNPPHTGYKALKAKLASLSQPKGPAQVAIPPGELLKPGDSDPRVPALRARLGLPGARGDLTYDPALVIAVKAFQDSVRLKPTGVLGAATVTALNRSVSAAPSAETKADIIANMERWRWLPRDLGAYYVWVNIPEYLARIHEGDAVIHETRIVVGKKETPTPLLSQDMRYAVVNPAWNIPPSIARNEMMPLLRSDPSALQRRGIEVVRNGSGGYTFRQSPGERNALGRIKFMFPNDHSVYLHDTPSKALFERDQRAFSHGCMRVQDPLEFGEALFNIGLPGENWTAQRIGKMFGGKERYVTLKQRIPVHVVYFTTFVNAAGRLETRDDLYGFNAEVKSRLGLGAAKRRMADGGAPARR